MSYLIWRWSTVDTELERQERIKHRIEHISATLSYGRPLVEPSGGITVSPLTQMKQNKEEEYDVKIGKVILSESGGVWHFIEKSLRGSLKGETEVNLLVTRRTPAVHDPRAFPDNIDDMYEMSLSEYGISESKSKIHKDAGIIELHIEKTDPDELQETISTWLSDLEAVLIPDSE